MSLNVNYTSLYKNGIDTSILKEVSKEILNRAAEKSSRFVNTSASQQVNSIAKPVELGIDLYQGKIEVNAQKQIAMNNTLQFQFNQTTLNSIQYLNSQAAIAKELTANTCLLLMKLLLKLKNQLKQIQHHTSSVFSQQQLPKIKKVQTLSTTVNFLLKMLKKKNKKTLNH